MKRKIYMFAAAFAIALAGCTDDDLIDYGVPVETGDEIMFASMLNGDQNAVDVMSGTSSPATRTVYGDRTKTGIPVHWVNGDKIAIYCPDSSAPADHLVNYAITPDKNNPAASGGMVKVDTEGAGLQWGPKEDHRFFGIYPASIVKETDTDDKAGIITAHLPTEQLPIAWKDTTLNIPGKGPRHVVYGAPNMNYSVMFAYNKVNKNDMTTKKHIDLKFQNLVTVLDIVVEGPADGEAPITVTNVNVDVVEGENVAICGDFDIHINHVDNDGKIECKPRVSAGGPTVTDRVSVSCYNAQEKKFITLAHQDYLVVKAFIIPDNTRPTDNPERFRQFRITVAMLNGSAKRISLNRDDLAASQVVVPHKINRIRLPKLEHADPAYWMSNLDPNIYVSELSIPGSKMSYLTENNGAETVYQTKTISEQFKDGVRAFIVQTGANCDYKYDWNLEMTYSFNENYNFNVPIYGLKNKKIDIKQTLVDIAAELQKAQEAGKKNDFAVVMLTADFNGVSGNSGVGSDRAWIETVKHYLKKLAKDSQLANYIYTDEVTPNTTIADVGGKIIIKVNYNNVNQRQWTSQGDNIPALFTMWTAPAADYKLLTEDMYWGWTGRGAQSSAKLKWTYQEVTNIGASDSEATLNTKVTAIKTLFQRGVDAYGEDALHMNWFMNDLGGKFVYQSDVPAADVPSELSNDLTKSVAYYINTLAVDELQRRGKNASTGLVFMNFADRDANSGAKVKSDYLLATIIDNNFKFALRKKGGSTPAAR